MGQWKSVVQELRSHELGKDSFNLPVLDMASFPQVSQTSTSVLAQLWFRTVSGCFTLSILSNCSNMESLNMTQNEKEALNTAHCHAKQTRPLSLCH